jgi:PAS domain S-box-containing protein
MNHTVSRPGSTDRRTGADPVDRLAEGNSADLGQSIAQPPKDDHPARTFTLRAYLTAMALAVMLPMGVLGAIAIGQAFNEYHHAYKERLRATARLLGIALDSEIRMRKTAIMAIAATPMLDEPVGPDLYNYAKEIGSELGAWVRIDTPAGRILNTRKPLGSTLSGTQWDAERAAQYHISNLIHSNELPTPYVAVAGPVMRDGKVVARVSIPFAYQQLSLRLAQGLFTNDGVVCLLDGNGVIIARTRNYEAYVGHHVPGWIIKAAAAPDQTIAFGHLIDGGDVIMATAHPSEAPAWTVVVAQPVAGYYQELYRPLMILAGGGMVLLIALLLLVDRFALWLIRPLRTLTQNAKIVARGGRERLPEVHSTSHVAEFETLRISLNDAAQVMDGRAEAIRVAFAAARRERNLLHSVVNGTSDPTFVRDLDGHIVLANAAGLAMHGRPPTTFLGKVHYEPGLNKTEAECRAEDRQVMALGQPLMIERTYEVNGERRSFIGTKSPWRSATGDVLGVVIIIHDITDWKRSENRLREIQGELIRTGRLSAMGAMANGLAHELNQPLAAITNFLGAARRLIAQAPAIQESASPARELALGVARGAIDDACIQAMRAGEIVSRLRDFIGRGVAAMRIETIGDMIADACALALPQDTRSRVDLRISIDPDLAPVFADRLQIQQVLVNIILNAVQSMAGSARQVVTITAAPDAAGDTCIQVADTGTGIPAAMLPEMFEPFVTTRPDGLGMGLAIARMIVTAHGGTLEASNNDDGGATLSLVLPAVLSMEGVDA